MKRRLRIRSLLDLLNQRGELTVDDACELTGASQATIRRAFAELAQDGEVRKTWGGIARLDSQPVRLGPPAFTSRLANQAGEKRAIAEAAAGILAEGDVIMIDGGTTTYQLAEFMAGKRVRVITNSLVIAQAIDQFQGSRRGAEVLLCGGTLQPESGIVAGSAAEAFLKRYRADWLFLGCAGIDEERVSNYDEKVLASEKLMIERSSKIVVMADHTKVGRAAMCELCPTRKVDRLITADPASPKVLREIAKCGVHVHKV